MEKDFCEEPSACSFPQLRDTFLLRKQTWNYNLPLKQKLEWIYERDQYDRMLRGLTDYVHYWMLRVSMNGEKRLDFHQSRQNNENGLETEISLQGLWL